MILSGAEFRTNNRQPNIFDYHRLVLLSNRGQDMREPSRDFLLFPVLFGEGFQVTIVVVYHTCVSQPSKGHDNVTMLCHRSN
jgi:hypothetical protein